MQHEGSLLPSARDLTGTLALETHSLNPWTARKVPSLSFHIFQGCPVLSDSWFIEQVFPLKWSHGFLKSSSGSFRKLLSIAWSPVFQNANSLPCSEVFFHSPLWLMLLPPHCPSNTETFIHTPQSEVDRMCRLPLASSSYLLVWWFHPILSVWSRQQNQVGFAQSMSQFPAGSANCSSAERRQPSLQLS